MSHIISTTDFKVETSQVIEGGVRIGEYIFKHPELIPYEDDTIIAVQSIPDYPWRWTLYERMWEWKEQRNSWGVWVPVPTPTLGPKICDVSEKHITPPLQERYSGAESQEGT